MRIAMIGQKGIQMDAKAGGVERHVRELSSRLAKRGHEVAVYARAKYHPKKPSRLLGVRLLYLPTIYLKHTEAIIHSFLATLDAVRRGFDVIHYHSVGPATLSWIPRLLLPKATVVVTFHSQDQFHQKWGWFARRYLALGELAATRFPHYCIAVSHILQVYCRDTFKREVVFIPNGAELPEHLADESKSAKELQKFGLEPKNYILAVGRLIRVKGLQFLIQAFREIKTDMHLAIVGASGFSDGYEQELRELAKGDDRIRFLGFQTKETLDVLYPNAAVFCHPSEWEGLPLAVLEAMSFGIAPLVSDIAPNVEAIHGAGITFESANVEDLKRKLEMLIANPKRIVELGKDAQEVVREYFNWDVITQETEEVYVTARH